MATAPLVRPSARDRILAAAAEVTRCDGASNLSLDAIAAQAGVSKGGLLYHFPNKAALMRALVETFISDFEKSLMAQPERSLLSRYVELTLEEYQKKESDASGVVAALAEDPDFLKPVEAFQRRLLDRLTNETINHAQILVVFLALEGLRSQRLFNFNVLSSEETEAVHKMLMDIALTVA